jgi:hypothetical protein
MMSTHALQKLQTPSNKMMFVSFDDSAHIFDDDDDDADEDEDDDDDDEDDEDSDDASTPSPTSDTVAKGLAFVIVEARTETNLKDIADDHMKKNRWNS